MKESKTTDVFQAEFGVGGKSVTVNRPPGNTSVVVCSSLQCVILCSLPQMSLQHSKTNFQESGISILGQTELWSLLQNNGHSRLSQLQCEGCQINKKRNKRQTMHLDNLMI